MLPTTVSELWASVISALGSIVLLWTLYPQYFPKELRRYFNKYTSIIINYFNPYINISFSEASEDRFKRSDAYLTVETYLSAKAPKTAKRLKAELGKDNSKVVLSLDVHQTVADEFRGVKIWWEVKQEVKTSRSFYNPRQETTMSYMLTFHKRYRDLIIESYLEHVMKEGKEIGVRNRQRKLYTNCSNEKSPWYMMKRSMWSSIFFEHPASFERIGMDPETKQEIVDDLWTFSKSKNYYEKIGKPWKRGYLLYGPPGTGKSTMIAAIANLLDYDVYDLELTAVKDNTELRKLLIETTAKSIIVIEDIDCSLDLTGQRKKKTKKSSDDDDENEIPEKGAKEEEKSNKVTLSGLLNVIDGLWSACGGERLFIFTTNFVEKLDPALIRKGRMDKHIELSYCSFEAFKVLAKNYLDLEKHPMFDTIQRLIGETKITPADVAENLMPKSSSDDADKCLLKLIQALEQAKEEAAKKKDEEEKLEE
ncbi:AAA-ATPase ASD, mitochondrial-like [Juglans microcarpa x Juglans regia]|uniref:AAA-ATPase ASD, mitochondrial-like n=1 Tax=Juglans microcarpa x Juglans regia TaxID=2249226 RepID=UPI001B7EE0E4|nr:AAA-ATPase ASD, mitochondrial-like [Juglans microcarpa x Juglans regia]